MRVRIFRIQENSSPQQVLRQALLLHVHAPHVRQRLHYQVPCFDILRWLAPNTSRFSDDDLRSNELMTRLVISSCSSKILANSRSYRSAHMNASTGVDQLGRDTHSVGALRTLPSSTYRTPSSLATLRISVAHP